MVEPGESGNRSGVIMVIGQIGPRTREEGAASNAKVPDDRLSNCTQIT